MKHTKKRNRKRETYARETYTLDKAAQILGISLSGAYQAVRRGEIPTVRFGKRILVPRKALQRLLEGSNNNAG
ncbi:MAG: helix-turn-helix domain-containing protein [Bryobacteraceae bacterium]